MRFVGKLHPPLELGTSFNSRVGNVMRGKSYAIKNKESKAIPVTDLGGL
jgi:hypothetical protein